MMAKGTTYTVTIELSEMELALLYHAVMEDRGERDQVLWKDGSVDRAERHYVSPRWLESKVFGQIAESQPGWLSVMEAAQKRLTPHR
jgi:hypothetical protein